MQLTKLQLERIIKEEISKALREYAKLEPNGCPKGWVPAPAGKGLGGCQPKVSLGYGPVGGLGRLAGVGAAARAAQIARTATTAQKVSPAIPALYAADKLLRQPVSGDVVDFPPEATGAARHARFRGSPEGS